MKTFLYFKIFLFLLSQEIIIYTTMRISVLLIIYLRYINNANENLKGLHYINWTLATGNLSTS